MAGDVDFVTVGATWIHGRADFEKCHTQLLNGRFKESANTPLKTSVRFMRPDLAVVHRSWLIQGDKNADGSARTKRFGLMTMLAEKEKSRDSSWQHRTRTGELGHRRWMKSSHRLSSPDPIQSHKQMRD